MKSGRSAPCAGTHQNRSVNKKERICLGLSTRISQVLLRGLGARSAFKTSVSQDEGAQILKRWAFGGRREVETGCASGTRDPCLETYCTAFFECTGQLAKSHRNGLVGTSGVSRETSMIFRRVLVQQQLSNHNLFVREMTACDVLSWRIGRLPCALCSCPRPAAASPLPGRVAHHGRRHGPTVC